MSVIVWNHNKASVQLKNPFKDHRKKCGTLFSSIIVRHSGTCEVCWTGCVGLVTVHSSSRKQRVIFDLQLHFIFHFFWLFSVGLHNAASSLFVSIFEDAAVVFEQPLLESSLVQTDTSFIHHFWWPGLVLLLYDFKCFKLFSCSWFDWIASCDCNCWPEHRGYLAELLQITQ